MVAHFLSMMQHNASAQVLIEAKIVEVQLTDQFVSGVNWNQLLAGVNNNYLNLGSYAPGAITNGPTTTGAGSVAFGIKSNSLDAVLKAAQRFGTTRTLSSPRLSATNNQQAVLTFARNEVFFNCTATPSTTVPGGGAGNTTIAGVTNCTPSAVPIGIILNILPAINLDKQEVTLNVRPTLTRVVGTATNPQSTATSDLGSYPVIEVRELDSVMRVSSGGIMVIGGLMEDTTRNASDAVPGLGEVPIVGNLFKSRSEDSSKRELIIFIKATIVNPNGSADPIDRKVYNKYVTDPRPLFGPQQ
jgi:MSHA biogenesis protein MshL